MKSLRILQEKEERNMNYYIGCDAHKRYFMFAAMAHDAARCSTELIFSGICPKIDRRCWHAFLPEFNKGEEAWEV
jgi:hypothetical protein